MADVCAPMPVAAAFPKLDEKLRKLVVLDPATLKKGEVLIDFDENPVVRDLYIKAWDKIKASE
jgi:hypothetical protein